MLTGHELLATVKHNRNLSKAALARVCGYTTLNPDGTEKRHRSKLLRAILEAKGVQLTPKKISRPLVRKPRTPKGAKVRFNGTLVIGSHLTKAMGLSRGDHFDIETEADRITLVKRVGSDLKTTATEDAAPVVCPMPSHEEQAIDPDTGNPQLATEWVDERLVA